ncbi:MAG: NUDIX domain-containing protein [Patescibacteria group bacterium]
MSRKSSGILLYKKKDKKLEVFLVHPGGPFWLRKDLGVWSIPKGEFNDDYPEVAARREFFEETGIKFSGDLMPLAPQKLKSGKVVYAFASEGEFEPYKLRSNKTEFGWPEVDRGEWFTSDVAVEKINPGQAGFIKELLDRFHL